jgi:lysyl-tRNA synthetase class 2
MWRSDVNRLRVRDFESSAIARAAYDEPAATLDLWYRGGDRYRYFDVPEAIYEALVAAPSAGEYVNREIKPRFRCEIEGRRRRFRPAE